EAAARADSRLTPTTRRGPDHRSGPLSSCGGSAGHFAGPQHVQVLVELVAVVLQGLVLEQVVLVAVAALVPRPALFQDELALAHGVGEPAAQPLSDPQRGRLLVEVGPVV